MADRIVIPIPKSAPLALKAKIIHLNNSQTIPQVKNALNAFSDSDMAEFPLIQNLADAMRLETTIESVYSSAFANERRTVELHGCLELPAQNGWIKELEFLLQRGADIHYENDIALRRACSRQDTSYKALVESLRTARARQNQIYEPIKTNSESQFSEIETIQFLLAHGANLHANSDEPLYLACIYNKEDVARFLLKAGANPNARDEGQFGILATVASRGILPMCKLLLEHGANLHAEDDWAVRWSATNNQIAVVRFLIESGANWRACNDWVWRFAHANKHEELIAVLKECATKGY